MRVILSALICLYATASVLDAQGPGGINAAKGDAVLLLRKVEFPVFRREKKDREEVIAIQLDEEVKALRKNYLEYSIPVGPMYGELLLGRLHEGSVGYKINPNLPKHVKKDTFEFKVKQVGADDKVVKVLGSKVVTLNIIDRAPDLEFLPKSIDFGKVAMGDEHTKSLIIKNIGSGAFQGRVAAPDGFKLNGENPLDLNIPVGGKKDLEVSFVAGWKAGKNQAVLVFQMPNFLWEVTLNYEVIPPFVVPAVVLLKHNNKDFSRSRVLHITSQSNKKLTGRLEVLKGKVLEVKPKDFRIDTKHGAADVMLHIPKENTGKFSGEVEISARGFSQKVKITADPCPARVVLVDGKNKILPNGDEILFEGDFNEKGKIMKKLTLRNKGGQVANIAVKFPTDRFLLFDGKGSDPLKSGDPFPLGPGESFPIRIELKTDEKYEGDETLIIDYGKIIKINLTGKVEGPPDIKIPGNVRPPAGTLRPPPGQRQGNLGGVSDRDYFYGRDQRDWSLLDTSIPSVEQIRIIEQRSDSCVISWSPQTGGAWDYVIDALVKLKDKKTGLPIHTWVEIMPEHFTITRRKSEIRAEIGGIVPGGEYKIRIITVSPEVGYSKPVEVGIKIKRRPKSFQWFRFWMLPVLGLVLCGIVSLVRRIRHERQLYG